MYRPDEIPAAIKNIASVKRWRTNVAETALTTVVMVEKDDWIKEHYADDNLIVAIASVGPAKSGAYRILGCTMQSNYPLFVTNNGTEAYGCACTNSGSTQNLGSTSIGSPINEEVSAGGILTGADGSLKWIANSSYNIVAGDYDVIAWLT